LERVISVIKKSSFTSNVVGSVVFKGGTLIIQVVSIPLYINLLGIQDYGIWISLFSIVNFFTLLDIGLGNGLKLELTKALSTKDYLLANSVISSTYFFLVIIFSFILFLFLLSNFFIDYDKLIFPKLDDSRLNLLVLIVFVPFIFQNIFSVINFILAAYQLHRFTSGILFLNNLIGLVSIIIISKFVIIKTDLIFYFFVIQAFLPPIIYFLSTFFFFKKHKVLIPAFGYINLQSGYDLLRLGLKFLVLQLVGFVIYQTNVFLIGYFFGPAKVTQFNVYYRLYFIVYTFFCLALSPISTYVTDLMMKRDFEKIIQYFKKSILIWTICVVFMVLLSNFSKFIIHQWIGNQIVFDRILNNCVFLYFVVLSWNTIFLYFLNGLGKLNFQILICTISIIVFPFLIYYFKVQYDQFSTYQVVLSNALSQLIISIFLPIYLFKVLIKFRHNNENI
jgi:O-antigen/teichoic acid export membrane protein